MALPPTLRVKLSSEAAGAIAITPVVSQDLALSELLQVLLAAAGYDVARVRDLLERGSVVNGATRYRWQGFQAEESDLAAALAQFPRSDPSLLFNAAKCTRAVLRGRAARVELTAQTAGRRRILRRRSYWDALLAECAAPEYREYSYRERADLFVASLDAGRAARLREAAKLLAYSALEQQIRCGAFDHVELWARR
ncbi:MAG TPA: hypothetical protein DEH78_25475 [Solibacterales bacterium]|nr:hypothetical protein [Bryobacterales bacterium]